MNFPNPYCGGCGAPRSACECAGLRWPLVGGHALGLVLLGAVAACVVPPPVEPAPAPPAPTTAPTATCGDVCTRARSLGCPGGSASPRGEGTCEDICENIQASGIIAWDLACRAAAPSCEAQDACER